MCLNPTIIKNITKRGVLNSTKKFLQVPCGKCDDCRSSMQMDWFLRCFYEIKRYNKNGGVTIFVTLTYRESCLPKTDIRLFNKGRYILMNPELQRNSLDRKMEVLENENEFAPIVHNRSQKEYFLSGFSKDDKNRFLDSLRGSLGVTDLRYLWCCEYGQSEGSTFRPHYHVLLHIPGSFFQGREYYAALFDIRQKIQKLWHYGMVRWSKPKFGFKAPAKFSGFKPQTFNIVSALDTAWLDCMVVDTDFAARYVGKYCTKDLSFYNNPTLSKFLEDEPKWFNTLSEDRHKMLSKRLKKQKLHYLKDLLPRHWQSHKYGDSLFEEIKEAHERGEDISRYFIDGVKINATSDKILGKDPFYKLPRYVYNRLCYRRLEDENGIKNNGVTVLSDFGKEIKELEFNHNVHYAKIDFDKKTSFIELSMRLSGFDLAKVFPQKGFQSISAVYNYIKSLNVDPLDYTLYKKVFQGVVFTDCKYYDLVESAFSCDDDESKIGVAFTFYRQQVDPECSQIYDVGFFDHYKDHFLKYQVHCASIPVFARCQELDGMLMRINMFYKDSVFKQYIANKERYSKLKKLYHGI